MIKMLVTDLDGTLLFPKRVFTLVHKKNKKFLRKFKENGGRVVIASGRGVPFCKKIINTLKIDCDLLAYNGASIFCNDVMLTEHFIPLFIIRKINQILDENEVKVMRVLMLKEPMQYALGWKFNFFEKIIFHFLRISNGRYYEKMNFKQIDFQEKINNENSKVYKMSVIFEGKNRKKVQNIATIIKEECGEKVDLSFLKHSLEITVKGINKGNQIEVLAKYLKIDKNEVAVVGDDGNDVSMFERFEHSFGIASGMKTAIEKSNTIIKTIADLEKYL